VSLGRATPYLRQKIRDDADGVTAFTPPASLVLGFTTATFSGSLSLLSSIASIECSGNGYARTTVSWTSSTFNASDGAGLATNKTLVTCFTATGNWSVPGVGFFFADASGNLHYTGDIDVATPILPALGQIVTFPPGSIILSTAAAA
jgi:hypothetical protein